MLQGVGKTALLQRYAEAKFSEVETPGSVGIEFVRRPPPPPPRSLGTERCLVQKFKMLKIAGKTVKLQIWDTGTIAQHRSLALSAHAAHLLVVCSWSGALPHRDRCLLPRRGWHRAHLRLHLHGTHISPVTAHMLKSGWWLVGVAGLV